MIDIRNIQGEKMLSVPITQPCQKVEELMTADHIQLSWNSELSDELPIGSYIEHEGEKYRLLEPYVPTQKNEAEYTYTPKFESRVRAWGKMPFFYYSGVSKEPDWTLTSNPSDFMKCICDAIKEESGEEWTYSIDASLPASASLSFSSVDILSGLSEIANEFETEWYADKETNTLYLGLLSHGDEAVLEVGSNINVPSVQSTKESYYTRFYAFGSTRNITQDYEGANANNIVNKRLTLDPNKYPDGYKDIRSGLSEGEIYSKVLIFDDVYPSANLSISSVRSRLMYRLDSDGNKIKLGTNDKGEPIYDQYAIWYFRIEGFDFDLSNIIEGYTLSVSFESGALTGREFELKYYEEDNTISTSDGSTFQARKGDYEILFIEEGDYIIPSLTGLVPSDGDNVVLFNIKMPSEYTQSAYEKLEERLDKEIERLSSDLNNYTFKSNPVAFNESNPNLSIGRKVKYVNGNYSYSTRVIKITTQLDFPIEQDITIGNEKVKGNTQQLKEEVASANKDLNLLSVFNDMTQSLQQSYARTQQMMLDGFAAIKDMWVLKTDSKGNRYAYSKFHVASENGITMYAAGEELNIPTIAQSLPYDGKTIWYNPDTQQIEVIGGTGGGSGEGVPNFWDLSGIPSWITTSKPKYTYSEIEGTPDLTKYALASQIPSLSGYATESWVLQKNYATKATTLSGYGITDAYTKANVDDLLKAYVTLGGTQTITGEKNFTGGLKVNGSPIYYDSTKKYWKLEGDLLVTGGITMYGSESSFIPSTIMDAILYDDDTLGINSNGELYVKGGTGGGVADSVAWTNVTDKPTWITDAKPTYTYSEITDAISLTEVQNYLTSNSYLNVTGGDNRYLKLSGGTLSAEGVPLIINSTASYASGINFAVSTTEKGHVGWWNRLGVRLQNNANQAGLAIGDDGTPMYYSNNASTTNDIKTLLHAGNYSSYALPLSGGTINGAWALNIKRSDGNYSSLITFSNTSGTLGYVGFTPDKRLAAWSDLNLSEYTIWHSGNDGSGSGLDADLLDGKHDGDLTAQYFSQGKILTEADTINKLMSGIFCYINGHNPVGSVGDNTILLSFRNYERTDMFQIVNCGNSHSLYYRSAANIGNSYENWTNWRTFAFTDSNVASATKLNDNTTFTAWGQTFFTNGKPVTVSGNLSSVNYIYAHDTIEIDAADHYNSSWARGLSFKANGVSEYGGLFAYGGAKSIARLVLNAKGNYASANGICVLDNGNVGIGTTSPQQKLHVEGHIWTNGDIAAKTKIQSFGNLIVNGNVGIGTESPSEKLHVKLSSGHVVAHFESALATQCVLTYKKSNGIAWSAGVGIREGGDNFGFWSTTSQKCVFSIDTSGNVLANGGITMYSMRKLKNVVNERGLSLTELSTIKPTRYTWKDGRDKRLHFGGIADDIQQVLPEVVYSTSDGVLTMDYGNAAFAVASSLIKPVIDHEKRIAMLEEENKQLRQEVERLKSA